MAETITITLTADQMLYVEELLGTQQAKHGFELLLASNLLPPLTDASTAADKAARDAALKPYSDRANYVFAIENVISAAWPKESRKP
jgi:hypothetical protein